MLQRMANELPSPSFRITLYCPVEDSGPKSRLSAKEPRPVYYTFSEEGRVVEKITHIYNIEPRGKRLSAFVAPLNKVSVAMV